MSKKFVIGIGITAVLALLIRLAYHHFAHHAVGDLSDAAAYHLLGKNLAAGRGYIRPFDFMDYGVHRATSEYPPLFPAFLAVLSVLGAGSITAQQIALAFVGTGTVVVTGVIGREIMGDAVGIVAAAIAAINPMLFQADGILMTESLTALLVAVCVLAAIKVRERPTLWRFVGLGAFLGVTTLNRAEGLLLAPLLILPVAFASRALPTKRRTALALVGLGTFVLVLAPWTVYNAQRFHTFVPVSNNLGTVLDGANCSLTYSGPYLGSWRGEFANGNTANFPCFGGFDIRNPKFDEVSAAAASRRRGIDYAKSHKRAWPRVAAARLARTWGVFRPAQQVNLAVLEGRNHTWEKLGTWFTWLLIPFAIAGVIILVRQRRVVWPLLAPIVTVSIVSVLTYGNQRFRIGADPMLAVLAAASIVTAAKMTMTTSAGARNRTAP